MKQNLNQMVEAVKKFANASYEHNGWDLVVETMSDEDIADLIKNCTNAIQAVSEVKRYIAPIHEHRREIQSTAF
jgi:hypothetical protein